MSRLSQESLTIIGVGVALAALIFTSFAGLRGEIHDFRDELRVEIRDVRIEARDDREVLRADASAGLEALRAEARADREALRAEARADREMFQNHILRLTEQQGILRARLDEGRDARIRGE